MIPSTHLSLLDALHGPTPRAAHWERFQSQYQETIFRWCLRSGLQPADAEDVTQAVLLRLFQSLPKHRHDPSRPFRTWLKAVVNNAVRDLHRAARRQPVLRGPGGSGFLEQLANLEAPEELDDLAETLQASTAPDLDEAITRVRARVAPDTWQVFWRVVVDGLPAAEVAAQEGISIGAVFQAKYRVSRLLAREHAAYNKEEPPQLTGGC